MDDHDEVEYPVTAYEIVHCDHDGEPVVHLTLSYAEVGLISDALHKFVPEQTERLFLQRADDNDEVLSNIAAFGTACLQQWCGIEQAMSPAAGEFIDWLEWGEEVNGA